MKKVIKNILFFTWSLLRQKKEQQHLFLMAHPRSGSSLLMHILTTNKSIAGFGEYLTKYINNSDFLKSEFDIRRKTLHFFKNYLYIANQINHHSITPNKEILSKKDVIVIFLIREPRSALSSMLNYSIKRNKPMSQKEIASFYIERLNYIAQLAPYLPNNNWTYLLYEDLINSIEKTLTKLSAFLKISKPLTSNYKIQKYTQVWGDTSNNIKKGAVFNTQSKTVLFEKELLEEANKSYQNTLNILKKINQ